MDLDNEELEATKNREKTADEMFEELGYKKIIDNKTELVYEYNEMLLGERFIHRFLFAKVLKLVFSYGKDLEMTCGFDIKELKAINKKCEELGWIK